MDCSVADGIGEAVQAAQNEDDAVEDARTGVHYAKLRAAVDALVESPKYRREQVNKRRHIAPAILIEAGLGEIDDVLLTHQVMPDANRIVNAEAMGFGDDFRARKGELAGGLSSVPEFYMKNNKAGKS